MAPVIKSWDDMRNKQIVLLERASGEGLDAWNARIRELAPADSSQLTGWLAAHGVHGYAQSLLVCETFGYPDFFLRSADELIDAQYADRLQLRPILDAVVLAATAFGELTVQARKTYVSLVGPRRTFAIVQATTRSRVDVGLRGLEAGGALLPARSLGNDTITARLPLTSSDDVDDEATGWLRAAYQSSR